jgi:hypothetical protein
MVSHCVLMMAWHGVPEEMDIVRDEVVVLM